MTRQTRSPRRVTVHEVADLANVSIATVSRVLNKPDKVNREMYERVMAAASRLGYTTNSAGKALKTARTRTIATLLPRLDDPIFSEIAHGIQEVLYAHGYAGFLQTSGYDNSAIFESAHSLLNRGAEGLLIFGKIEDQRLLEFLTVNPVPVMQIYSYLHDSGLPSCGIDNYAACRKVAELMLQLGHRDIAYIAGPTAGNDRQRSRLDAYKDIMEANGLTPNIQAVQPGYSINDGGQAMRRALSANGNTSAIICATDILACGVLAECRKLSISVPERLSITGFEDVNFAPLLYRPLTTLAIPSAPMGRHAARALIASLEEGEALVSMEFDTTLIVRDSVSKARQDTITAA